MGGMRYLPLIGIAALIMIGVCWRSWLQRQRYGSWGIFLFRSRDSGQILRDSFLILISVLVAGQALGTALWPEMIARSLMTRPRNLPGGVALFAGIALTVRAQLDLGASWRVGIDDTAAPELVTRGLYTLSRNPIFLGILTTLAGFALLIPNALSFINLAGSMIGIRQQVLREEAYLRRIYGADYLSYAGRVGRFIPGIGKIR
jgi:protein-S-isoprenylcysteine O-methyltransferase Ste14